MAPAVRAVIDLKQDDGALQCHVDYRVNFHKKWWTLCTVLNLDRHGIHQRDVLGVMLQVPQDSCKLYHLCSCCDKIFLFFSVAS